jgi:hypothetical protein
MKVVYYWMIFSLTAFIPLVFDFRFDAMLSTEQPRKALQSAPVYLLSVAYLSSAITAMVELLLDCASKEVPELLDYRFLSLLGLSIFEAVCLAVKDYHNAPTIILVTSYWHLLTEVILSISFLNELCPRIFTLTRMAIPLVFFAAATAVVFTAATLGDSYPFLEPLHLLFLNLFQFTLFFVVFIWLYDQYSDFRSSNLDLKVYFETVLSVSDFCILLIILFAGTELLILINVVPYALNAKLVYAW